jgi:ribosomal protein S18 acetylase RimI-like enzyme
VKHVLDNPVYQGLTSGDRGLSYGTVHVKFFDEKVSPFAGFDEDYGKGFEDLYDILPEGRTILYAIPRPIPLPKGWQLLAELTGVQMLFQADTIPSAPPARFDLVPLQDEHIDQMIALADLTRPGPFGPRTIDFGHYYGIFEGDQLVAMTGQRLHVHQFTEVSAVCTHPNHLGKGYAAALVGHAVQLILGQNQTPFLHVRADNTRAIELYQRLGFAIRSDMNFYFMKKQPNP